MKSLPSLMRFVLPITLVLAAGQGAASAATLTYQPTQNVPGTDDTSLYTWRITGGETVVPTGQVVTAALLFDNGAREANDPDKLFLQLLDTAATAGTQIGTSSSREDTSNVYRSVDDSNTATSGASSQGFIVNRPGGNTAMMPSGQASGTTRAITSGAEYTGRTAIRRGSKNSTAGGSGTTGDYSFATTPADYQYDFDDAQVAKLNEYIASDGDIARALDPEGQSFDDGMTLNVLGGPQDVTPTPEPATLTLLGLGFGAAYVRRRAARRRSATV